MSSDLQSDAHGKSSEWGADNKRRAPSSDLGRNAFVFDEDEVVHLLRTAADKWLSCKGPRPSQGLRRRVSADQPTTSHV
jgi:hypothetical protein